MYDPRDLDSPERDRDDARADLSRGGRAGGDEARDREDRSDDPRDVVTRGLDLPEREERELVLVRDRSYELNGPESRTLATVGAFRVVRTADLRDLADSKAMRHLRDQSLVKPVPLGGRDRDVVVLTREGRDVLQVRRRDDVREPRQVFHAGLRKPRELTHDAAVYRAYRRASGRLRDKGADVHRVVLDYELKREYQEFLQACNRDRPDSDGRPNRTEEEVAGWAREHGLPYFDDHVHFPDVRIEYEDR
ncbi:MAG: hypothetical protein ABJC89_26935, partial [Acidobacteriota bacterium]